MVSLARRLARRPQHEAFAFHLLDTFHGARTVADLTGVIFVVKLGEVKPSMLAAYVMMRSVNCTLAVAEKFFGGVRRNFFARRSFSGIFLCRVNYGLMGSKLLASFPVNRGIRRC